jgi:hypothetical protein
MKTLKFTFLPVATFVLMLLYAGSLSAQIQFAGLYAEGEGGAAWDADGTGSEPYGNGHSDIFYYTASRDYIDPTSSSGAHMLDILSGFPLFEKALLENGFTAEQVTLKVALASLGDDIRGIDWFTIGNMHYANFYPVKCFIELDGEPLVEAFGNYAVYFSGPFIQGFETGYLKVYNISGFSTESARYVAAALMTDLGSDELKIEMNVTNAAPIRGNGRTGCYFNVSAEITKGLQKLPFQGLNPDHEGFACWDADGTGMEPYGNGHLNQLYYGASLDYDGIDPDPAACLGHFTNGSTGFHNTLLQIQYRGFSIGDLKIKLGQESLGPDIYGEDWVFVNGYHSCNYYNRNIVIEFNGEPILAFMQDTNKLQGLFGVSHKFSCTSGAGKVYNISQNASPEAQFVALSFLKDIGSHYLKTLTSDLRYHSTFSGNGRDGALYEIPAGEVVGIHEQATFIPEGTLSGVLTAANSPYFIDGHQSIETGQTLIIEPGVKVKVRGPYHFDVQGTVIAEGTADENIIFTRSNPNLWWDGFDYFDTPSENQASVFDHCIFEYGYGQGSGTGANSGGAFAIYGYDALSVSNSVFRYNKVNLSGYYPPSGGAVGLWDASPMFSKCTFYNNEAEYGGALFSFEQSDPVVSNCLFYNNYGTYGGAITLWDNCDGTYINNTIADNLSEQGGAIYFYWHSNPEIINNIIWGNTAEEGNQIYFAAMGPSYPGFYYNNIEGGKEGFHGGSSVEYLFNLDADPQFMGIDPNPYAISNETSPCWNAGTPDTSAWYYPQYLPATCLCGSQRFADGCLDIGAYEYMLATEISPVQFPALTLKVQPNPFNNHLQIKFSLSEKAAVSLNIYNSVGEKIAETDYGILLAGEIEKTLRLPDLHEGVYIITVRINNYLLAEKVVRIK